MNTYCTYLRVSTQRQGAQGLGISAQRAMCDNFINQNKGKLLHEFMDVESGTHRDRKGLWQAIDYCKKNDCGLVIAKLDRLARDVEFTFKVINTGIDIHFTDMPIVNSMVLGVFASVAQYEREMCSKRTKDALLVKKAQGCKLGAASEKYIKTMKEKTLKEKEEIFKKRGNAKVENGFQKKDTQMFLKIIRKVFEFDEDMAKWDLNRITSFGNKKYELFQSMKDFQEVDGELFKNWDLSDFERKKLHRQMVAYLQSLKKSIQRKLALVS